MRQGKYTILVVEDDRKLAAALKDYFEGYDYIVTNAFDGETALEMFYSCNHEIDLILLDVMLPGISGYRVLKEIREYADVPIIMATSRETEEDQLKGLENGADNYITKPFRLSVLKAHVEIILNRRMSKERLIRAAKLQIDLLAQRVYIEHREIGVTPKEFALLVYFIQNRKVVLTREMILDAVWGYDYEGDIRTVDTLVKQLRKKLTEECPYIRSVYGVGYCFEEESNE